MSLRYNLNRLSHFVATVDAGTITGAAEALGISKAVVSKQLQRLEEDVGTPLLLRNTRHLQPTAAGRQFYEDAKSALTQANNAFERVQDRDRVPKGTLRITAPVDFGVSYVAPFLAKFQDTYPEVMVDLHLSDGLVDIIEDRFDLAFRIGWLTDSSNLARKLLDFEVIAICSPTTAARANIREPEDLSDLPFVQSSVMSGRTEWVFEKDTQSKAVSPNVISEINITLAMVAHVMNGYCYTVLPDFLLKDDLRQGRLKRLLPDWSLMKGGVYTGTPPNRVRSNELKRLLELENKNISVESV
ncbi:LysR family transcriptional regulator [Synechococcus sp. MU1644]|nr:LysR family transcriptional regulator [Synechococcus sp. MU1644]